MAKNKSNKKIPTVSVILCAYNEAPNIRAMLESVVVQEEKGFKLEEIVVFNDGSEDETAEEVMAVNSNKINLVNKKARSGKSALLNEIYSKVNSDIIIQTDADIIFKNKKVISHMIKPLVKDEHVGLVGGNHIPAPGTTFTEKSVNYSFEAYLPLRTEVRGGHNLFSVAGCILAMRKDFYKKLVIPASMINNDVFTYYTCLDMGYKYKYAPLAKVIFRQPQTLKDQIKQNTRFLAGHKRMYSYFPKDLVNRESFVPKKLKIKLLFKGFVKNPIHALYIFTVNKYAAYMAKQKGEKLTGKWRMATTTKSV